MSGTSADGVDVAIIEVEGRGVEMRARLVQHSHRPYERALRRLIVGMRETGSVELATLAQCGRAISLSYAAAIASALSAAGMQPGELEAIAAHGQTLFHDPPNTIQWFDPALVAATTGCRVVSDFRRADCAAGGQGAPLVPFADYILYRSTTSARALVNIGGIANVTLLPAGGSIDTLLAFDVGPGNCVSDHLARLHDPDGPGVDLNGQRAARGQPRTQLIDAFMRHPYFARAAPKSTDGPAMIEAFTTALRAVGGSIPLEDQLATACMITAKTIAFAINGTGGFDKELIVSGGGVRNAQIMRCLAAEFAQGQIRTSDEIGIPAEAREAMAFALLGAATLDGVPSNVPSCTGARRPVVLGSVTPCP